METLLTAGVEASDGATYRVSAAGEALRRGIKICRLIYHPVQQHIKSYRYAIHTYNNSINYNTCNTTTQNCNTYI
jgi:hypothetical protein